MEPQRGLVCPLKAQEFDELHMKAPRFGKNNRGAKELAGGYTNGEQRQQQLASWRGGGAS